ncbi:MAG: phosphohydrolase [Desulfosarcinaceae bacterium]|nr:phosphohydrolase [Desulfosarcinaceae bacterium]
MKCPGQDTQYWQADAIFDVTCPACGKTVEFFKDDTLRKCHHCGHRFMNPQMDFGCAAYCQYAEQCIGDLPPELIAQKDDLLKDRIAVAVKRHLKTDFTRIGQASRVARHADQIGRKAAANMAVVLSAAYLHVLDRSAAEAILAELKAPPGLAQAVLAVLAGDGGDDDTAVAADIVADAVHIEDLEARAKAGQGGAIRFRNDEFNTPAAGEVARQVLAALL